MAGLPELFPDLGEAWIVANVVQYTGDSDLSNATSSEFTLKEINVARLQNIACQSMGGMFMQQHMLIVEPVNTILREFLMDHLGQPQWSLEEWH